MLRTEKASPSTTTTTSTVTTALRHSPILEAKFTDEDRLSQSRERGKKKFGNYIAQKTRVSKKNDLFATIDFGTEEEENKLFEDADVQAYLQENPDFVPGAVYTLEHNAGIGRIIKGKQTAPDILTLSNLPIKKLDLSEYGIDLDALLEKHGLTTIRLAPTLLMDGLSISDDTPVLGFHLTSGADKKAVRKNERALIREVRKALLKTHKVIYRGGDGQDNLIKIAKNGKAPEIKDGHMVLNEDIREILDEDNDSVTTTSVKFSDPKIKERAYRTNRKFQGDSPVTNQKDKLKPDAASKMLSTSDRNWQDGDAPNSQLLARYPLPHEGTEEYLATSDKVSDHQPAVQKGKVTRAFTGGVSQEGAKAFKDPHTLYKKEFFYTDENGNELIRPEVLDAGVTFVSKLYALVVSNCARVNLTAPGETPVVDTRAIKAPKTSLGYMEAFYEALSAVNIDVFKSPEEIMTECKEFDFNNRDQVENLTAALKKMDMAPITTSDEMKAIFTSQDKKNIRRLCLALRDVGIDPFKTEAEMMSAFKSKDEDEVTKLAAAINQLLQVQAIEPGEEKQAAFTSELRMAFKKSVVELLKSDEFDKNYHVYAHPDHVKSQGHVRRGTVPNDVFDAQIEALAETILEHANAASDGGSGRSPWNLLFQKAFNMELSGGFVIVAGKMPTVEDMRIELCIENARLFAELRVSGKIAILNITETSSKGLGKAAEAKKQRVGDFYSDTAMQYQEFYKHGQAAVLRQQTQKKATQDATTALSSSRYSSFSSSGGVRKPPVRDIAATYERTRATMGR